ncbi:MAG: EAL domain-containing protein [Erythrobacter sp.]
MPSFLLRPMRSFAGSDDRAERAHEPLVASLYSQPGTMVIGTVTTVGATWAAARVADTDWLWIAFAVVAIVGAGRLALTVLLRRESAYFEPETREFAYKVGAFAFALALGLTSGGAVWFDADSGVELLLVANAIGYGIGVSARNAGRPSIAIGQLALVCVPTALAGLLVGDLVHVVLAINLILLIAAMISIARSIFGVLRDALSSAETSRTLAERMQHLARTDVVTGLSNRAGLNNGLVETMATLDPDTCLALFWIDLDRFKDVNDLHGHPAGDKVLAEIAGRLRGLAPRPATLARFAGDEFIVVAPVADRAAAERLASEIHCEIMRPQRVNDERLELRASLGVAMLPDHGTDADTLMRAADLALYHAKVGGRSQTRFFERQMTRDLARRREIETELRSALQRDELSIFFQPIVDLETARIRSFEALVRWFHPEKGELLPDEFIPIAEESGVIVTLGNWITMQAARVAATWPEDITVAVNLSPMQIRAPGAALGIRNALREAGLDPRRLELEVTEALFLEDTPTTAAFIEELTEIGVRFALDDFGTGYSSLGSINSFPLSKIKVDRSFVSGAKVGRKSDAIIRAVAEMGSTLGMGVVAEGLETVEQVNAVRAAGCNLGQGYYFSRAVPDYLATMLLAQEREAQLRQAND